MRNKATHYPMTSVMPCQDATESRRAVRLMPGPGRGLRPALQGLF
jgi:hypothetical protein